MGLRPGREDVLLTLMLSLALVYCCASAARGADFEITPSMSVSEEYNDNIFLRKEDKVGDYITSAMPSVALKYATPLWQWDAAYAFDYLYYAAKTRNDDKIHNLAANGLIALIRDRLMLKLSDDYSRAPLDVARDVTRESAFLNQSDRNIFTLNPYFIVEPAPLIKVTTGYAYIDTWYKNDSGVSKTVNTFFTEPSYELSPKIVLNAGYRYSQEASRESDFTKNDIYVGSRYEYADRSNIFFKVGNSLVKFTGRSGSGNMFWTAGISHAFPTFTGSVETSSDYTENPLGTIDKTTNYMASVKKEFKRTTASLSLAYTEFKNAETVTYHVNRYGVNANARYELTAKTTGAVDFTAEKLDDKVLNTYTRRYFAGLKFDYELWKETSVSAGYNYAYSYSPEITGDTYRNNRFLVGVRKTF